MVFSCWHDSPQVALTSVARMYDAGKSCVFNDMRDRLVPVAREWLDAATPNKGCTIDVAKQAYSDITEWMMENRSWIFSQRSPCLVHKKLCPVHPFYAGDTHGKRLRRSSSEASSSRYDGEQSTSSQRPLYVSTSGMTCVGWSAVGRNLQFADSSEAINAIFFAERRLFAEDLPTEMDIMQSEWINITEETQISVVLEQAC